MEDYNQYWKYIGQSRIQRQLGNGLVILDASQGNDGMWSIQILSQGIAIRPDIRYADFADLVRNAEYHAKMYIKSMLSELD